MPESVIHELRISPWSFDAVLSGAKPFEVRPDDRGYKVGDILILREWDASLLEQSPSPLMGVPPNLTPDCYTGRVAHRIVTYILRHDDYPEAICEGYCVLWTNEKATADA